jgi:1,4-alpha-glucan branching enzyme
VHKAFPLYLKAPCAAKELLNTEAEDWGGPCKALRALHTTEGGVYERDYTLSVDLPAMGSCLFRLTPDAPAKKSAP